MAGISTTQLINTTAYHHHNISLSVESKVIGATMAVVGNVIISVALNIQKYVHNQLAGSDKSYIKSLMWWVGMTLMGLGELGNFAAYGFAPASLVAPLGSTGVVANAIIAVLFLKEKLRLRDVVGIVWAVLGGCLIVTFSHSNYVNLSADELLYYVKQYAYIVYAIIQLIILLAIGLLHYYKIYVTVVTILLQTAIFASFTVISAKAVSFMFVITSQGKNQLVYPIFYFMFLILVISIILQIKYLNQAMANFDASVVIPINFILFTISALLSGIIFYQEFYQLTALNILLLLFGATLSFLGVFLISGGRDANGQGEEDAALLREKGAE